MEPDQCLKSLICLSLVLLVSTQPIDDDKSDLLGPYCEHIGCCGGRSDTCASPIIGTLCYCDDFCMNTTNADRSLDDCCPDYYFLCRGIVLPTRPPFPTTTTRRPPEQFVQPECIHRGQRVPWMGKVKENCNTCICERVGDKVEMVCETNECLVDEDLIEQINSRETRDGWSAQKYNDFWGRTLDDGIKLRLGTLKPERSVMNMNPVRRIYDPRSLPLQFDAEKEWPGFISGIQDQGWCGSSWAVSTAAVASDRYAIISSGLEKVQLSAQNLVSCDTQGQNSCAGGYLDRAWHFIKKFGLVDEACFPYVGTNVKCAIEKTGSLVDSGCVPPTHGLRKERYTTGPAYRLGNETDIMYEIMKSGPVQATMKVYHDFFQYNGGIYKHSTGSPSDVHGYHSVRIIGWGEEYSWDGSLKKYWKVANSWGSNWGEDGYFRIAKGTDESEIESFVIGSWPKVTSKILRQLRNQRVKRH